MSATARKQQVIVSGRMSIYGRSDIYNKEQQMTQSGYKELRHGI